MICTTSTSLRALVLGAAAGLAWAGPASAQDAPPAAPAAPSADQAVPPAGPTTAVPTADGSPTTAADAPAPSGGTDIVVTGTRIRGIAPVGAAVISLNQQAIKDTGIAQTTDLLRTVPQISNIGSDEGRTGSGAGGQTFNIAQSSGINLRGLGTAATLVLVNGRRPAPGGVFGNLFDPATIPTIAIGNVEVLADGSSALYGSDAIAGVVNLGLRKINGLEVNGRYTTADGYHSQRFSGVAGHSFERGSVMIAGEYVHNTILKASDRPELFIGAGSSAITQIPSSQANPIGYSSTTPLPNFTLNGVAYAENRDGTVTANAKNIFSVWAAGNYLPRTTRYSIVGNGDYEIVDGVKLYLQGHYSRRKYDLLTARGTLGGAGASTTTLRLGAGNPYLVQFFARNNLGPVPTPTPALSFGYLEQIGPSYQEGYNSNWLGVGGAVIDLPHDFKLDLSISHGENREHRLSTNLLNNAALATALNSTNAATAFNAFGPTPAAVLSSIRAFNNQTTGYDLTLAAAKVDGSLFALPAGDVKIALGAEYAWNKDTVFNFSNVNSVPDINGPPIYQDTSRKMNVASAYGEIVVPVFGSSNATAGFQRLDLTAAVRYDRYDVKPCRVNTVAGAALSQGVACAATDPTFSTVNPKFGVTWKPTSDITLRGSYGTSFRYNLLVADANGAPLYAALTNYSDAVLGVTTAVRRGGGFPDLKPETAKTWTLGAEYKPAWAPGLELTTTYFNVRYKNIIGNPDAIFGGNNATTSAQYAAYLIRRPSKLTPGASDTAFNALVASVLGSNFYTNGAIVPNTAAGIASVNVYVEQRSQNIGRLNTDGIDFTASYRFGLGETNWLLGLTGTKYFHYKRAVAPTQAPVEVADLIDNPTSYRLRGQVGLNVGPLRSNLFINYTPDYVNTFDTAGGIPTTLGAPGTRVKSQTTFDLSAGLDLGKFGDNFALRGLTVGIDVTNLFDKKPAFARVGAPIIQYFDTSTASGLRRQIAFRVSKAF